MDKSRLVQITRQDKIAEEDFYPAVAFMYEQIWQNLLPPQILTDGLSVRIANNVITPAGAPVPDCLTCGACCAAMPCVGVRPDEEIPDGDYWDITAQDENIVDRFLRRNEETLACAALEGTLGENVSCRIYEKRPVMCHHFEAGSDKCHALRRAFGFEPFFTLAEMTEAIQKLNAEPENSVSSETIRNAQFTVEADNLRITALMHDGSLKVIHTFDPKRETWRQFEFDGLTLSAAADLIKSRTPEAGDKSSKV